ncbi:MAG: DUF6752 domain-containing protein [Nocardioidaceae bacterium]
MKQLLSRVMSLRADARLDALEREVQELRQLSRRLADVLDVVGELLVPALDRDDERIRAALARWDQHS